MGVVNAKILIDNLERMDGLRKVGLSNETIASASRDKTGDASITSNDIESFLKIGKIASKQMLISANQGKKLTKFAQNAESTAKKIVDDFKKRSKSEESQTSMVN